jgi:tetratricopeptide (TPR) repeat protein
MDADKNIADPGRSQELYRQGREAMERNAYDVAVAAFAESARLEPHFKTLELLGECYIHLGQSQKAVVPLAAATTLNDQVRAPALLSDVLAKLGDTYNARRICEIALARDPQNKIARKVHEQLTVGSDLVEKE